MQYRFIMLGFLVCGGMTLAESPGAIPPTTGGTVNTGRPINPNVIQTLDDKFFDSKPGPTAAPSVNEFGRAYGPEDEINTEQRAQAIKACEQYKEKDGEKYRKCFQDEKNKIVEQLKGGRDAVERRQMEPLRNVNPLLDEQRRRMDGPAGDD